MIVSKRVTLTIDNGPTAGVTAGVLDVLARRGIHATFFVIGEKVNEHPELVRRMLAEGNDVGVHTFTHAELVTVPLWRRQLELALCQNAIAGAAGVNSALMRPPFPPNPTR